MHFENLPDCRTPPPILRLRCRTKTERRTTRARGKRAGWRGGPRSTRGSNRRVAHQRERQPDSTKGGEALLKDAGLEAGGSAAAVAAEPRWYALWTKSHCERLVHEQIVARGFCAFLPEIDVWSRRSAVRRLVSEPMFPGYLFLRHAMNKAAYIEVVKARGLVRILGEQWDQLHAVSDGEIAAIQRVLTARVPVLPFPFLQHGRRVRITRGPLADVEGILVETKPDKGLLVLSVDLLRRSVAVEVDCTHVAAG